MAQRRVDATQRTASDRITALVGRGMDWSPRAVSEVVDDILSGEHSYYVEEDGTRTPIEIVTNRADVRLRTRADDSVDNNLEALPRIPVGVRDAGHGRTTADLFRPIPIRLRQSQGLPRIAARVGVVVLIIACLLAVRPENWLFAGGTERFPTIFVAPRVFIVAVTTGLAVSGSLLAWGLVAVKRRLAGLGVLLLALFVLASARSMASPFSSAMEEQGVSLFPDLPSDIFLVGLAIAVCLWVSAGCAVILLILGILIVIRPRDRTLTQVIAALAALLGLLGPVLAYGISLLPRGAAAQWLTTTTELNAVDESVTLHQAMSAALLYMYYALQYGVVALAMWQAGTYADAVHEYTSAMAVRIRSRRAVTIVAILACLKLVVIMYGYAGRLPSVLGGDADIWGFVRSPLEWLVIFAYLVALGFIVRRALPRSEADALATRRQVLGAGVTVGLLIAVPTAVEVIAIAVNAISPQILGPTTLSTPLYANVEQIYSIVVLACCIMAIYHWNRKRAAAVVYVLVVLILVPVVLGDVGLPGYSIGLGAFDAAISLVFAVVAVGAASGRNTLPAWLLALWLGSTALAHFGTLVPPDVQLSIFALGLLLAPFYSFVWRAGELNESAKSNPAIMGLALGLASFIVLTSLIVLKVGDRGVRDWNSAIQLWQGVTYTSKIVLAFPILIVLLALPLGTSFGKPLHRREASRKNGRSG